MPERQKIALCLEYPLALRGGVSVLVETLLPGFKEHYDLILVSPDRPEELARHPVAPILSGHIAWQPRDVSPRTSRTLADALAQQEVRLAHFHLGGVFGWGNRFPGHCPFPSVNKRGIAVFSTVHLVVNLLDGYCGPQKPLWFKLALLPLAWAGKIQSLAHVRKEIAVSRHDAEKLRRWYWPMRGKFVQLYHSRLMEKNPPSIPSSRDKIILNVGHIAWRKGQELLAEAFAQIAPRHPDWKLMLVGAALETRSLEKIQLIASTNGLTDRILLPGERSDAMQLMPHAAIYVQPSYQEALGLALQEALFNGCACIGTRAGGIPELIENEKTGLLVETGNIAQMAEALEKLMRDPALRERYGRQAQASILEKGMTASQMTANHLQLYEHALRNA